MNNPIVEEIEKMIAQVHAASAVPLDHFMVTPEVMVKFQLQLQIVELKRQNKMLRKKNKALREKLKK